MHTKMLSVKLATHKSFLIIFLLTITFFILFILFPNNTFAQTPATISGQYTTPYDSRLTTPNSPHTASMAIYNFGHAMSCIMIGQSPISPCLEYKMYRDAQGIVKSVPVIGSADTNHGVLGMSLSMIGEVISTPPIRSSEFIANLGEQFGVESANAQVGGSGSGVLAPIFKLWEVSRNIAYLVMILIFVLVGLMVMFRQKLNPQTVVSIQMALPGLVIGLVMITFSYFLAALISDTAFLGTNIVNYYFSLAQGQNAPARSALVDEAGKDQNIIEIFARNLGIIHSGNISSEPGGIKPALDAMWAYIPGETAFWLRIFAGAVVTQVTNSYSVGFTALPKIGQGLQVLINGVAFTYGFTSPTSSVALAISFIAWFVLLYSMFKLLMRLISSFLTIIFLTVTAPFHFLAASVPGKQGIATQWLFNMLCNVLAFPAVYAVFYFAAFIIGKPDPAFPITAPTTLANGQVFPLLGGLKLDFLNSLVAFGALVASPSIPDIICKAVGKPSQFGGIAAGAISGAIASGQKYNAQTQQGGAGFGRSVASARALGGTSSYTSSFNQATGQTEYHENPYGTSIGGWDKFQLWRRGGVKHRAGSEGNIFNSGGHGGNSDAHGGDTVAGGPGGAPPPRRPVRP